MAGFTRRHSQNRRGQSRYQERPQLIREAVDHARKVGKLTGGADRSSFVPA
jgi:hypothetical protein